MADKTIDQLTTEITSPALADLFLIQRASDRTTGKITKGNLLETERTRATESTFDFVASGGVWTGDSYGASRNASMTAMIVYVNGRRISIGAVTARTFTASKDTYVDVLDNQDGTGTLVYTEVANGAASPALASNSVRIAKIVTDASSIAAASSITQTGVDSLNNYIYPNNALGLNSYKTWTPSWVNLTIGNATVDAKYREIGRHVNFRLAVVLGTTSSVGSLPTFSLPTTAVASPNIALPLAFGNFASKNAWASWQSTTTALLRFWDSNNDLGNVTATQPITWGNGSTILLSGFYEKP